MARLIGARQAAAVSNCNIAFVAGPPALISAPTRHVPVAPIVLRFDCLTCTIGQLTRLDARNLKRKLFPKDYPF